MNTATPDKLVAFERRIADLWEDGQLPFLIHLCGGNEKMLCRIFEGIKPSDWVLSTHRNHFHYLLKGGSESDLEYKIRAGRSMFVFDKSLNFLSSAILGGMCGVAAGIALGIKLAGCDSKVICFVGDGAADNGHLYEAAQFVEQSSLPCRFIIEDNNRSCGVTIKQRGGYTGVLNQLTCVHQYGYVPTYPHAGSGCKHHIQFNPDVVSQFATNP